MTLITTIRMTACLTGLALSATLATAGVVSYDSNIPLTTLSLVAVPLNFQQFDGSLGTLTSVKVEILGSNGLGLTEVESTGTLTDLDAGGSINLDINIKAFYTFTGLITPSGFNLVAPIFVGGLAQNQTITWNPGSPSFTFATLGTTHSATILSGFVPFIGLGTIDATDVSVSGNYFGTLPTNYTQSAATQAQVAGRITYTYDAASSTPEPATMALLGSALIGLGVFGRKRLARR